MKRSRENLKIETFLQNLIDHTEAGFARVLHRSLEPINKSIEQGELYKISKDSSKNEDLWDMAALTEYLNDIFPVPSAPYFFQLPRNITARASRNAVSSQETPVVSVNHAKLQKRVLNRQETPPTASGRGFIPKLVQPESPQTIITPRALDLSTPLTDRYPEKVRDDDEDSNTLFPIDSIMGKPGRTPAAKPHRQPVSAKSQSAKAIPTEPHMTDICPSPTSSIDITHQPAQPKIGKPPSLAERKKATIKHTMKRAGRSSLASSDRKNIGEKESQPEWTSSQQEQMMGKLNLSPYPLSRQASGDGKAERCLKRTATGSSHMSTDLRRLATDTHLRSTAATSSDSTLLGGKSAEMKEHRFCIPAIPSKVTLKPTPASSSTDAPHIDPPRVKLEEGEVPGEPEPREKKYNLVPQGVKTLVTQDHNLKGSATLNARRLGAQLEKEAKAKAASTPLARTTPLEKVELSTPNTKIRPAVPLFSPESSPDIQRERNAQKLAEMRLEKRRIPKDDSYEISDRENSGDEGGNPIERTPSIGKVVPTWVSNYREKKQSQINVDPDTIFCENIPSVNLEEIFGRKLDWRKRGSCVPWDGDQLTADEISRYKKNMEHASKIVPRDSWHNEDSESGIRLNKK